MNRIYRVVFNAVSGVWQAVSEVARGPGKSSRSARRLRRSALSAAAAGVLAMSSGAAFASCTPPFLLPAVTCTDITNNYAEPAWSATTYNVAPGALMQSTMSGNPAMLLTGSGLTVNNYGIVGAHSGSVLAAPTTGLKILAGSGLPLRVNNLNASAGIYGLWGNLPPTLNNFNGLALDIQNPFVTVVNNGGTISAQALPESTEPAYNRPVIAIHGGGSVDMTNTGQVIGRIAFQGSAQGNVFTNVGYVLGSLSMGASGNNRFNAVTGSAVNFNDGTAGALGNSAGVDLQFAPSGVVDAGAGGNNTLSLQNAVGGGTGPAGSGDIDAASYRNFSHLKVTSGTWNLRGALLDGSTTSTSTSLDGGVLTVNNSGFAGTGVISANGGTLNTESAMLTLGNNFALDANGLRLGGGGSFTLNGSIAGTDGAASLYKLDSGQLVLSGLNTYAGGTTLSAGTLTVGHNLSLGSGRLTVAGASTLNSRASVVLNNPVTLNANLTVNGANDLRLNGSVSGAGKLVKTGTGNLTLAADNNFSGGLELHGGGLTLANGVTDSLGAGSLMVTGNSRLTNLSAQRIDQAIMIDSRTTLEVQTAAELTLTGRLAGDGTLAKTGSAQLLLVTMDSVFTGTLDVREGQVTVLSALDGNPNLNVAAGAQVELNADTFINNLTGAGVVRNAGALSAGIGNTSATFNGVLDGGGRLVKLGRGTLTLNGNNTMTGMTDINAGALVLNGSLAAGPVNVKSGASISGSGFMSGTLSVANGGRLDLKSGSTLSVGSLELQSGSIVNVALDTPTLTPMANVAGHLTLAGIFNFSATEGLSNGVYRLFNYGGALLASGGRYGSLPDGISVGQLQIQTGVANQVNVIVNSPNLGMQFWDGNASVANGTVDGGPGTWSANGSNWTTSSGNSNKAWAGESAIFQGAGGDVTVVGAHNVKFMQFTGNGYNLFKGAAGQLNLVNAASGDTEVRVDAEVTARLGVDLAGTGMLSKTSAGTLVLAGSNQYSGGTTLKAGRLVAHSNTALGTGLLTASSGTTLANQQSVSLGNNLQLDGGLILDAGSSMTLGGTIAGRGGLTKSGSGTLVLNGSNAMAGDFALDAGSVVVGSATALGQGTLKTAAGTSIDSRLPGVGVGNDVVITGALSVLGTRDLALTGKVSGNGNLIKTGGAALNLLGANTLNGSVTLAAGTLRLGTDSSLGNTALKVTGAATLQAAADIAVANDVDLAGDLAVLGGNALALNGLVSGSAGLTKEGSGTLTLGHANTYLGGTELKNGTLRLGNGQALGTGALNVTGSATLDSTRSMALDNAVANSGNLTLQGSNETTLYGAISGAGSLTKAGTGTLTLGGANTSTGTTTIEAGRLLASASNLASGAITNNATLELQQADDGTLAQAISGSGRLTKSGVGTLTLTGANTSTGSTAIIAGGIVASAANLGSGIIVNQGTLELKQSTDATLAQAIFGGGTLTKTGEGTLTLTGANSSTGAMHIEAGELVAAVASLGSGAIVNDASLQINQATDATLAQAISGSGNLVKSGAGTLTLTGANGSNGVTGIAGGRLVASVANLASGLIINNAALELKQAADATLAQDLGGSGDLFKTGEGTLTLTGANTSTGGTHIVAGGLVASVANLGSGAIANDGALQINQATDATLAQAISGNGDMVKAGAGTLTLTGANTTTGLTGIAEGRLVASVANLGSGDITNNAALELKQATGATLAQAISGNGDLTKSGAGTLTLTGANSSTGGTAIEAGRLVAGAANLGSGAITNHAALELKQATDATLAQAISGSGDLTKSGAGTLTLTGSNSYAGNTRVAAGSLKLADANAQTPSTKILAGNIQVAGGAALEIATASTVTVGKSVDLQQDAQLSIQSRGAQPSLLADSLLIGANVGFNLSGIGARSELDRVLISTTNGIAGDFGRVNVGGFNGVVDYLTLATSKSADGKQYLASYGLNWTAGNNLSQGTFTLSDATDQFDVGVALDDQKANAATGWNGKTLTKKGAGTLVLSADNGYTGGTAIDAGTLQVGNGGTGGTLGTGDIANEGTLAFNRSDLLNVGNQISGSGKLVQKGTGTTVLLADNSYTGTTAIEAGTLQVGAGGTSGALGSGNITNDGTLAINRSDAVTLANAITGSGSLHQQGTGTTTLTGANDYSGGTTISAGRLIASGDKLGSGAIVNNAALELKQATDATLAQAISGSGDLTKSGAGTLMLTGANTSTGGTAIEAGRLVASAANLGSGAIRNNAALELKQASDATLAQAISGSGDLTKSGAGTLTLTGANTSTGSISIDAGRLVASVDSLGHGAIVNNAALELKQCTNATLAQAISGSGDLTKSGAGTLTLTGANTSTGGTTIDAGRLVVSSANLGSGAITNNAALELHQSTDATLAQAIAGSGDLTKSGAGMLTLTGENTSTGGTRIDAGRLVVSAANLGSGAITNNAALELNQALDATLAQAISGSGDLTKSGAGTLTLTGANSATGGTVIEAGRLVASVANLGSGAIRNNAALELNQAVDATLAQTLSGSGRLRKTGAGTLTLTADSSAFSGSTALDAGTLALGSGAVLGGSLNVAGGATLTGSGGVGSTTLASGAIIAPGSTSATGHSYGTLSVNGDLTFAPGSTYQFHADPDSGTSDRIQVSGTVKLAGGLLHVGPGAGFDVAKSYTLLQAASLQGQFDTVASNYAYLDPKLQYGANALSLVLERKQVPVDPVDPGTPSRPIGFADLANTSNQTGVANGVESLNPASVLYRFVQSLPEGTPAAVFESLSGEVHSTAQGSTRTGAQLFGSTALRHLHSNLTANLRAGAPIAQADGPLPASAWPSSKALPVWAEVVGHWQSYSGDGNAARLKQSTGGLFLGGDSEVAGSGWRVGGSLGYTRTDARVADRSSTGKVDSYSAAVYGGKSFGAGVGQLNVMGGLAYTWHDITSERHVAALDQTLKADYHAGTSQLFAEVGYALGQYGKVGIEPYAGISLGEQRTRGFQESGGFAALRGEASRDDLASTTLGLRMHSDFKLGRSEGRLRGTLGWRHAFGDVSTQTRMAFEGGQNFSVAGVPLARNTALLGLEAELELSRSAALVLGYKGEFGSGNRDHSAQVRVRWAF